MATTQNTYTGNGSTTNYSFTFEYLKQSDVKVTLDTVATTAFTFANATTIAFTSAPANSVAIRIFRDTAIDTLSSTFFSGSAIKAEDLNQNFTQSLYVTQESETAVGISDTTANTAKTTAEGAVTTANGAVTTANSAVTTANSAVTTANSAVTTANTADTNASAAVTTANAASTTATTASNNAASAVTTANTASTTAGTAVTTANSAATDAATAITTANGAVTTANAATTAASNAQTDANSATSTANTAATNASNAVTTANSATSTANTANTNATAAVNTANAASAAVSNAVLFTLVATVAAIPGSPSNNDYIEIGNSTGIESFSPLSGLPSGFVGASGLTVRLRYDSSASSWVFMSYFANDSEDRYLTKNIPLGSATAPSFAFTGDTNTGIYSPGADQVAITTGGTGRLYVDGSGNVGIGKTPGTSLDIKGAADCYLTLEAGAASGNDGILFKNSAGVQKGVIFYDTDDNYMLFSTASTERLRIDSSGNVGIGTSSPDQLLHLSNSSGPVLRFENTDTSIVGGNSFGSIEFESRDSSAAAGVVAKIEGFAHTTMDGSSVNGGAIRFSTATVNPVTLTERLRIDSSGNVGIGTTNPLAKLHVESAATTAGWQLRTDSVGLNNESGFYRDASDNYELVIRNGLGGLSFIKNDGGTSTANLAFNVQGSERMRIDSSGRLLVGTSSALTGTNSANGILTIKGYPGTPSSAAIFNSLARGLNSASIANGNTLGRIVFAETTGW